MNAITLSQIVAVKELQKKKGELSQLPFLGCAPVLELECVSPVKKYIDPVDALADAAIRRCCAIDLVAFSEVVAGLADRVAHVSRVKPPDVETDIHARRDHVPHTPLPQKTSVAVVLGARPAEPKRGTQNVTTPRRVTT